MNLNWYLNRARSMTIREIFLYRIPQFLITKLLLRLHLLIKHDYKLELRKEFESPKYNSKQIKELFNKYPWHFKYHFFEACVPLNKTIDWLKDYHNDINSSQKYYTSINRQDFNKNGDVKYISELSRMHFLPFMAFHYINTNDEQVLKNITSILKTWETQNPFPNSINYTSGIEVGIRSLNLIYTHLILNSFDRLTKDLDQLIKQLIWNNYRFLKSNLSLYSSANNHLVGELMGLIVISTYFDGSGIKINKWKSRFIKLLKAKYNIDGVDDELSSRYHLAVTDHFLNGLLFLRHSGYTFDKTIEKQFKKSFDFIKHIKYKSVEMYFGDNDDSYLINPFFVENFSLPDSLFESDHYYFNNSKSNTLDFRNYLMFGSDYFNCDIKEQPLLESTFFKESGYAFSYNHNKKIKIAFDCGNIGDNKLMAHGHSDQLSFILQLDDFIYIVDPGTYQYHSIYSKWRNYFKGIKAHNTISVNNKEHAKSLNRMGWTNASKVLKSQFETTNEKDIISAQIGGFEKEGILHSRTLTHNKQENNILIEDFLEVIGDDSSKKISFYMHFNSKADIKHTQDTISVISPSGKQIQLLNKLFRSAKLIKGDKELPLGWYSNSYDSIQECTSLLLEFNIKSSTKLKTQINY